MQRPKQLQCQRSALLARHYLIAGYAEQVRRVHYLTPTQSPVLLAAAKELRDAAIIVESSFPRRCPVMGTSINITVSLILLSLPVLTDHAHAHRIKVQFSSRIRKRHTPSSRLFCIPPHSYNTLRIRDKNVSLDALVYCSMMTPRIEALGEIRLAHMRTSVTGWAELPRSMYLTVTLLPVMKHGHFVQSTKHKAQSTRLVTQEDFSQLLNFRSSSLNHPNPPTPLVTLKHKRQAHQHYTYPHQKHLQPPNHNPPQPPKCASSSAPSTTPQAQAAQP